MSEEKRIRVKISTIINEPLKRQTPSESLQWGRCDFFVNRFDITECDYWVIFAGLQKNEKVKCPKENTIFISAEPSQEYLQEFLDQFARVISPDRGFDHPGLIKYCPCIPWWVGRRYIGETNSWVQDYRFTYDELSVMPKVEKTQNMSGIVSSLQALEYHKKRHQFMELLKDEFGDQIDFYGRGMQDFQDKWDVIAPYRFHLVMENAIFNDYLSEKLTDSYLAEALPIYSGAPNIGDYFDNDAFIPIDLNDMETALKTVRNLLEHPEIYEERYEKIKEAKNLILNKYNLFAMIAGLAEKDGIVKIQKGTIILGPQKNFGRGRILKRFLLQVRKFFKI